jgi:hypothetical protein
MLDQVLRRTLRPASAVRRLLMTLNFEAFIDDSRTKPSGEFVLGGHIAPAENWALFSKEWEDLLPLGTRAKNGNFHFHMVEMASQSARMERVPRFYQVIEKYVTLSISCRLNSDDFVRAQERMKIVAARMNWHINCGRWNNPYYFLVRALIDKFHKVRHEKIDRIILVDEKVDFIFDKQSEEAFIREAWSLWVEYRDEAIRNRYGVAPRFEDDQEFLPLQAADLWAWWVRHWYEEDAVDLPDKMRLYDFGKWKGTLRPMTYFSINEDQISADCFSVP